MDIQDLRSEIDQIDAELVKLFCRRMDVSAQVADYKRENNLPIYVPAREREIKAKVAEAAGDEMGRRNFTTEVGYWTPENKSNEWRSLSKTSNRHGYGFSQDASFTRVKDITLSYTFTPEMMKKVGLGGLTVYASGRNLFTFTDWVGWDPEARNDGRGSGAWADNYPMTKSYVFGINLTF